MGRGISKVTINLALLICSIIIALLILSPVGSWISNSLKRSDLVGGQTTIEVAASTQLETDSPIIYVRNLGPRAIELGSEKKPRDPPYGRF